MSDFTTTYDAGLSISVDTQSAIQPCNQFEKSIEQLVDVINDFKQAAVDAFNKTEKSSQKAGIVGVRALKDFNNTIEKSSRAVNSFKNDVVNGFGKVNTAFNVIAAPAKALVGVYSALEATTIAVGAASITAAGDYEMFRQQLQTVLGTVDDANAAFEQSVEFASATPFSIDDIVQVRVALENVGVEGPKAVKQTAEAAAGLKRQMIDVAAAVRSLEIEPLRNLGLSDTDLAIIKEVKSTEGFDAARLALLDMFDKYSGGIERMSYTIQGLNSTMWDNIKILRAEFGEGFLDETKLVVMDITQAAKDLKPLAKELGEAFGDDLGQFRASMLASIDVAKAVAEEVKGALSVDDGNAKVILRTFELGAELLGDGIVSAIRVSLPIWDTIGTTMMEGAIHAFYGSDIVGASYARENAIQSSLEGMSGSQLRALAGQYGVNVMSPQGAYQNLTPYALSQLSDTEAQRAYSFKSSDQLSDELASKVIDTMAVDDQVKFLRELYDYSELAGQYSALPEQIKTEVSVFGQQALDDFQAYVDDISAISGSSGINASDIYKHSYDQYLAQGEKTKAEIADILQGGTAASNKTSSSQTSISSGNNADFSKYFKEIENEKKLLGLTNEERERAIKLTELQSEAEKTYGENSHETVELLENYKQKLIELEDARQLREIADGIGDSFASAFENMATGASKASDAVKALLQDIEALVIRQLITQNIANGISNGVYNLFGGGKTSQSQSMSNGYMGTTSPYSSNYVGSAKGNVFYGGDLVKFDSGGIFTSPHYFPMTGGRTGVTAEAGKPEAQMPLVRMPGGDLGVKAISGKGGNSVNVKINVDNQSSQKLDMEQGDVNFDGDNYIIDVVMKNINTGGVLRSAMGGRN